MDGAKEQMKRALLDADGFKPGSPLDFTTFARNTVLSENAKTDPCLALLFGGRPHGYQSKRMGHPVKGAFVSMIGPCSKGDMGYTDDEPCGGCGQKPRRPQGSTAEIAGTRSTAARLASATTTSVTRSFAVRPRLRS